MENLAIIGQCLNQPEAQEEALKILLSISSDPDSQNLLETEKNIIKELVSMFDENKCSNLVLQILINLSENEDIGSLLVSSNNIFEILFNYLKSNLNPNQKDEKSDVGYVADENVYVVKTATESNIPLILMLMNNLTTYKVGREKFLNASDNFDLKYFMLENLIAMTDFFKHSDIFNFGANVINN